jgi:6-phosphofructokinase 1
MPDLFISDDGMGVTKAFEDYLRPLVGISIGQVHRLRHNPVAKILKSP